MEKDNQNRAAKNTVNTRMLILDMLLEITSGKEYSHLVIRNVLDKYNYLTTEEKSFMKRVCEGTLERMIQIDFVLNQFSNTKVNKMKPVIRTILRMSVYQILFMDTIPDSAACNEAVKLAEKKKFHQLKGFVNGILRTVIRQKEAIVYPSKEENLVLYESIHYSMPEWIVEKWLLEYDVSTLEQILEGLLQEHAVTIRMDENLDEQESRRLQEEIAAMGITIERHPYLPYAYVLEHMSGVMNLPGFQEGKVTVQDISSMLVAEAADVKAGDSILDVCAAPGGKALHMACKLKETGHVEARDLTSYKVSLIEQNMARMNYTNIEAIEADAAVYQEEKKESVDILLADLPCSGLGVIGKKRDIKYKVSKESLQDISNLQRTILDTVQAYVKPGGTLVYSTCTINKQENEEMIAWFTENYPYELESLRPYMPKELQDTTIDKGYLQLLPGIHKADGFFLARLKKKRN